MFRARSLASVVHGALTLVLGLAAAFMQRVAREQLSELGRLAPGGGLKQPLAEGAALGLCGALLFVLGLTQLHTGMTSPTAVEAFVVAEAALCALVAALGVARGDAFFFLLGAEPAIFCAWGVVELAIAKGVFGGGAGGKAGGAGSDGAAAAAAAATPAPGVAASSKSTDGKSA